MPHDVTSDMTLHCLPVHLFRGVLSLRGHLIMFVPYLAGSAVAQW